MNIVDWVGIVFVLVFMLAAFRAGLILAFGSLIGLILALIVGTLSLPMLMNTLEGVGWRENIYTPILVFVTSIIVLWVIVFTIFTLISTKKLSIYFKILGSLVWGIQAVIIFAICCLVLPQSSLSIELMRNANQSLVYREFSGLDIVQSAKSNQLKSIDQSLAASIILSGNQNEVIPIDIDNTQIKPSPNDAAQLFELMNNERQKVGLEKLERDSTLEVLAEDYAVYITKSKKLTHVVGGITLEGRAKQNGIKYDYLGENLALAPAVGLAHQGLMDSKSHKDNILSPVFRRVGVGVVDLGLSGKIFVEEFSN